MREEMPRQKRPCAECPWRRDVAPGQFRRERYEALADTSGSEGDDRSPFAPMFGCHKGADGRELACAGWLAVVGRYHIGVRIALLSGQVPASALEPGEGWPPLFSSYAEMARTQAD